MSEKGAVGSGGGGEGGSGGGGNKKVSSKDDSEPKALEALVVGGNFTLHGKSTNVAQYDPVRCVCRALSGFGRNLKARQGKDRLGFFPLGKGGWWRGATVGTVVRVVVTLTEWVEVEGDE